MSHDERDATSASAPEPRWRYRCNQCLLVLDARQVLTAPSPFDADDELEGCPDCKQCRFGFTRLCDEPAGCDRDATCGWPDGHGWYRHTCGRHVEPWRQKQVRGKQEGGR